jgi:hypothetical protein
MGVVAGFLAMWLPIFLELETIVVNLAAVAIVIIGGVLAAVAEPDKRWFWIGFCVGVPAGAILWFGLLLWALGSVGS